MSEIQQSVTIQKELSDVVGAFVDLAIAVKWGNVNTVAQLGVFVGLLGEFSAVPAELTSDPVATANTLSLQVVRLVNGLLVKPA